MPRIKEIIMKTEEKVKILEDKGFNWLEIADIIDITYEEVREISDRLNN